MSGSPRELEGAMERVFEGARAKADDDAWRSRRLR